MRTSFTIDELNKVKTILVHKDCSDGIASAVILHMAMPWTTVKFIQYGTEEHSNLQYEEGQFFCDLSPPRARYEEFKGALILDHHDTAKDIVLSLDGIYQEEPGISGATLAFQHVWTPLQGKKHCLYVTYEVYWFSRLAGIFDTWQKDSPAWWQAKDLAEALRLYPWHTWEKRLADPDMQSVVEERCDVGELLVCRNEDHAQDVAEHAWKTTLSDGTTLAVIAGIYTVNLVADHTGTDLTVGFNYYIENNIPKIRLSCRSRGKVDVGNLASFYGGGGHPKAAGFNIENLSAREHNPFVMVADIIEGFIRTKQWV